jgi:hypothetical protein
MIPRTADNVPIEFRTPYYWLDDEEEWWDPPVVECTVSDVHDGKDFEEYKGNFTVGIRVALSEGTYDRECGNLEIFGSKAAAQAVADARRADNEAATDAMYEDALRDAAPSGEKG